MLTLGRKTLSVPILQGGMGVGVSLGGLAGAVAACGGMGCISTADAGYREPDFARDPASANHRALTAEIKKAKQIAKGAGMVAINAMVATQDYAAAIRTAVEAGVDAVVSGAGLPLELPGIVGTTDVAIAPIVSSGRAAKLILRRWAKEFGRTADFVVIEGCKAGGHLGFAEDDLLAGKCQTLDDILPEVLAEVKPFEAQFGHSIPVFVAGGVYTGADMAHFTAMAEAGGIPVILYNVPSRTGLSIAPETAKELSKHPLINGIKEASGNIGQVAKIAALCGDELNIYSGNDDQVVPLLALGGKGVISVVANVKPELVHNCCKAFFDGDTAKARELQLEMLPLADALFCEVNPIPVKYAMNVLGWEAGECRLPLVEPSEAHKEYIEKALRAEGLITE